MTKLWEELNLDDNLITIGDSFINSYISLKINTEFVYVKVPRYFKQTSIQNVEQNYLLL